MDGSIFLVIAEDGDYSDYMTWVAAGLLSKIEAARIARELTEKAESVQTKYAAYTKRRMEIAKEICPEAILLSVVSVWRLDKEKQRAFHAAVGPCPKDAEAGSYTVVEVPINKIGRYGPHEDG